MSDSYRGPTADDLLPTQRINEGIMYQEHLVQMFGEEQALRGVPLEIVDATGGSLKSDAGSSKIKATILLTFKGPDGKALPMKLGINQTIKKALIARFDSVVLAEWVGWVVLYVDPNVEDKRTRTKVRAIRAQNVAPKLAPTFDYAANVAARIERARKNRSTSTAPKAGVVELTAEQRAAAEHTQPDLDEQIQFVDRIAEEMDRAARSRSAAGEGFTPDPEDAS